MEIAIAVSFPDPLGSYPFVPGVGMIANVGLQEPSGASPEYYCLFLRHRLDASPLSGIKGIDGFFIYTLNSTEIIEDY